MEEGRDFQLFKIKKNPAVFRRRRRIIPTPWLTLLSVSETQVRINLNSYFQLTLILYLKVNKY